MDIQREDTLYNQGDRVFIKLQSYRQATLAYRTNQKLCKRYFGPYQVIQRFGPVSDIKVNQPPISELVHYFMSPSLTCIKEPRPMNQVLAPYSIDNQPIVRAASIKVT